MKNFEPTYNSPFVKWKREKNPLRYRFELSIDVKEKDVISQLEKQTNKSAYVKELIRKDIKKKGA